MPTLAEEEAAVAADAEEAELARASSSRSAPEQNSPRPPSVGDDASPAPLKVGRTGAGGVACAASRVPVSRQISHLIVVVAPTRLSSSLLALSG